MTDLFAPYQLGDLSLSNRLVMAPLTRNGAGVGEAPTELAAQYYGQRATAGLIVTEGTQPSAAGQGYPHTPGLHTDEQVAGWRLVADAVHARGGKVIAQLMHTGRISHSAIIGQQPVAPSAVTPDGEVYTEQGMQAFQEPRALETAELAGIVAEYVDAARRAVEAGLDGIELHAANGYLLQQFLSDSTNIRTDGYGGSPQNRARFVIEVASAVSEAIGAGRVGIGSRPGARSTTSPRPRPRRRTPPCSTGSRRSACCTCTSSKVPRPTSASRSASSGRGRSSSTPASPDRPTCGPRRPRSTAANPTCSASDGPSWPIPTWSSVCRPAPSSTSPTWRASTAAASTATPTTRP